jgi:hypothetical protein
MARGPTQTELRRRSAEQAMAALGASRDGAERMTVQCDRSHHVAVVYATDAGPVVLTRPGPHAHGSKDFVDTAHHGAERTDRIDLLDAGPGVDDEVPAWCDCGPVVLSRTALLGHLAAHERTVRIPGS